MMLFDTHAHYDDDQFDPDRDELLRSMPANNVGLIVNPGCDLVTSRRAVEFSETYDFMYAAVGIHPEQLQNMQPGDLAAVEQLASTHAKVRAIGEIGLDYYWEKDPTVRKQQQELFRAQMRLAGRLKLPVIIHDRDAHLDCLTIVEQYPKVHGVFHCYAGSVETAKELLQLGYFLSFTGVITFPNARKSHEVIAMMPLDRIMIETDSPYLTPAPFRGKRNSSLYVHRMAEQIAEIRGMETEEIIRITTENGKRFFDIS